jgi:hypothetical protein
VNLGAENNYNKGFRLTRRDCIESGVSRGRVTPTTETQRHGEEQQSEQKLTAEARIRGEKQEFLLEIGGDLDRRDGMSVRVGDELGFKRSRNTGNHGCI